MSMPNENPFEPDELDSSTPRELNESLRTLYTLFTVVTVTCIILTAGVGLFFLREVSLARKQAAELQSFIQNYQTTSVPLMERVRDKFQEFAKTHPDFNRVLAKYFNPTNLPGSATLPTIDMPSSPP